ncbi:MAG: VanZ family protein [Prevotella sp.]|nr:VanZ family protein [Prevotella sp.]
MKYLYQTVRRYPFSSLLIGVIWYLSFFTPPKTGLDNVAFIDKWVHVVMYGGTCAVIWTEYIRRHRVAAPLRLFLLAWLAPIVMSGVIELLQEYCTDGRRSGDWLDLAANATGVTLAAVAGSLFFRIYRGQSRR